MSERFRTIGIDIGGTNIKIAALWSDGSIIRAFQFPTQAAEGPEAACKRLIDAIDNLVQVEKIPVQQMRAIGVDSAGIVDPKQNIVVDSPNLRAWERFPLAERITAKFGVPVYVENDVNAMAYGEWRCGAGRGARHLVCLTLGTGVGGGLILDGQLYRGAHGAAGEVGHMTIDVHGPACNCPNVGCLERYVGAEYIVERALRKLASDPRPSALRGLPRGQLDPADLSVAADSGDGIAADVLEETGHLLGMGLVSLVNIFNPERIVIGGGVAKGGARIFDPAQHAVRQHAMKLPAETVRIVPAELGNDAAVVGAVLLSLERASEAVRG